MGTGSAGMLRPSAVSLRANRPRAAKCGSASASSTLATIAQQTSLPANLVRHSFEVRVAIFSATAPRLASGSAASSRNLGSSPIASQKLLQNRSSSGAAARYRPSAAA
jgi:hypothetical protein